MGIGAICVVIFTLPMTSVRPTTLLLAPDGLAVMPLVIAAVVVAHLVGNCLADVASSVPSTGSLALWPPTRWSPGWPAAWRFGRPGLAVGGW
jgi:hypothetical protein